MPDSYSIYEAKTNFSMIVRDSAEHGKVILVTNAQRKSAPRAIVLGEETLRTLLEQFLCHPVWEEDAEKGLWTVYVPEADIFGEGETKDEAVDDLLRHAREVAALYLDDIKLYEKVGRSAELPYMLKVALARDGTEMRDALGL